MLRARAAACAEALGRFPATLEEDDLLLRDGDLGGSRARDCVVVRRREKRVLHRLRAAAESRAREPPRPSRSSP